MDALLQEQGMKHLHRVFVEVRAVPVPVPQVGELRVAQGPQLAAPGVVVNTLRRGEVPEIHAHQQVEATLVRLSDQVHHLADVFGDGLLAEDVTARGQRFADERVMT